MPWRRSVAHNTGFSPCVLNRVEDPNVIVASIFTLPTKPSVSNTKEGPTGQVAPCRSMKHKYGRFVLRAFDPFRLIPILRPFCPTLANQMI